MSQPSLAVLYILNSAWPGLALETRLLALYHVVKIVFMINLQYPSNKPTVTNTYPFAVVVNLFAEVTVRGAVLVRAWLVWVHLGVERLADVVLQEVVPAVLPHTFLRPEDSLAALVLAVEVLGVLHLALLEPATLVLVEPEEVLLPDVLRDGLG